MTLSDLVRLANQECTCGEPTCGLLMVSRCHPMAGCVVKFFKIGCVLQISCCACDELVQQLELGGVDPKSLS
jgi:hypothetical protein